MQKTHPERAGNPAPDSAFTAADFGASSYTGWLHDRMQANVEKRLLQVDLDMLLAPFENRPGSQWWAGEHAGKFLHAATLAWRFTGRDDLRQRMDYAARKLIDAQLADGYLGTYEEKDRFAEGDGLDWNGPVWDVWTHKYCLIGLLSYFRSTGEDSALAASRRAADLLYETFVTGKRPMRLASAHVGMAATSVLEPIAVLYQLTGDERYLEFCHYLVRSWEDEDNPCTWKYEDGCQLLSSLLEHGNVHRTANRKAYEMLSNLVGLLELYRVDPDARYLTACQNAWADIVSKRRYVTGTTSYYEQFTPAYRLPPGEAVGEGCVTVTWMQLNIHLLELTGDVGYADELERTIYNALPAAQSPLTGAVAYFVPLVGRRHFGSHDKGAPPISCCSSSIPRGLALIPATAAGTLNGKPALLQYIPGRHALLENLTLVVRGDYPESGNLEIEVEVPHTTRLALLLRVPEWADDFLATVNGESCSPAGDRWLEIERDWSPGDTVQLKIPLPIRSVPDGDQSRQSIAFMRGPQVLVATAASGDADSRDTSEWRGLGPYTCKCPQGGVEKEFRLWGFADAGQNMQEYTAIQDGIKPGEAVAE